jgi:tRNA threonylcarbamoyladenosine biosynthesis protein TsaE
MKPETLEIITESASETQKVGEILAKEIIGQPAKKNKKALAIGLEGELGSGKTTFIQGLAKGLGIKERITSPTFVIFKKFNFRLASHLQYFYHIDCYRLNFAQELLDLGVKEIINQPESLIVIEWAERVKKILPQDTWWIRFEYLDKDKRKIILSATALSVSLFGSLRPNPY